MLEVQNCQLFIFMDEAYVRLALVGSRGHACNISLFSHNFKTFNHFIIPHNKTSDFKGFFVRKEQSEIRVTCSSAVFFSLLFSPVVPRPVVVNLISGLL